MFESLLIEFGVKTGVFDVVPMVGSEGRQFRFTLRP